MRDLIDALASLPVPTDGPELIDEVGDSEELKCLIAARQARIAVAFDLDQRRSQAAAGVPVAEQGKGVAAQIALARRESPARGGRLLGFARALVTEMPHTMAAVEAGLLNEWRATLLVRETACLSAADRCAVDEDLAADTGAFDGAGDRQIVAAARAAAYRRDPRSVTQRASHAAADRRVSLRPAPDTMTYLTALLPVAQGVAVHAELTRHADTRRAAGDERSRGQLMADALVERTTGTPGGFSRVEVQLVMTDRTLFQGDAEPALLPGYGIVPAGWARNLLTTGPASEQASGQPSQRPGTQCGGSGGGGNAAERSSEDGIEARQGFQVWLRRLYTAPGSGELVAVESRTRLFTAGQRRFIQARDHLCRAPYCDAPIRHYDHIIPWYKDGPTTLSNGAGLCEACNHTKELPGWHTRPRSSPGSRHVIEISTPTSHTYHSTAPPLPGSSPNKREHQRERKQETGRHPLPPTPPAASSFAPEDHNTPAYPYTRQSRRAQLLFA
ncbi:HNH endonuclease signature motif containing protein [Arthrobacter sp. SX1312]|uniref:HNH endonuclease n=1 Tax=Arthrobacter sp. SX1312 TaxID=2058896 RepID=UPI0027D2C3EA|nr:HNH endonuclease signature motif containing protein [Arthrobacter sp. SX1312]